MEFTPNPHDRLFKETLSHKENARSFLEHYLSDYLLSSIDMNSLEVCKETFIQKELREYFSDLLYKADLSGMPGYLYFLFEHKSHSETRVSLQLLGYMQNIWNLHLKQGALPLPVVIPIVLYHGGENWTGRNDLLHLFGRTEKQFVIHIPDFQYILYDLSRYPDEEIRGTVMFRVAMLLFKYVFHPDYHERLPSIFALLRSLLEKETGMQYIETIIRYVLSTVENMEAEDLKTMVEQTLSPEEGGLVMTLAEKLRTEGMEQGIQQGIERGIEQGIQQGLLEGITALIEIKFGQSGRKLLLKIGKIEDTARLRQIKEAIKVSKDVQDLEKVLYH